VSEREIISPQGVLERRERVLAILRLLKPLLYQFHIDLCSFDDADDGNTNDIENNNFNIAYGAARHETNEPTTLSMPSRGTKKIKRGTNRRSPPSQTRSQACSWQRDALKLASALLPSLNLKTALVGTVKAKTNPLLLATLIVQFPRAMLRSLQLAALSGGDRYTHR
jgi:hypothetical protein